MPSPLPVQRFSSPLLNILLQSSKHSPLTSTVTRRRAHTISNADLTHLDADKGDRERVVILGSGWAGYILSRRLSPKKYQTIVISPRSYFVFTPLLTSTAVGTLEFRTAMEPVRSRAYPGVHLMQGWADSVDFTNQKVTMEGVVLDRHQVHALAESRDAGEASEELEIEKNEQRRAGKRWDVGYDKLVLAVGAYNRTFKTKGVKENAYFMKDVRDARKIRKRVLECFEIAALPTSSEELRRQLLRFAVVGGGPTGMEFAAELSDLVNEDFKKLYPELVPLVKVVVLDVAPRVLSMFDESLSEYAVRTYHRAGIEIKTYVFLKSQSMTINSNNQRSSCSVEELRPGLPHSPGEQPLCEGDEGEGCYTLRTKDGDLGVGMCVWSTGNMRNPFIRKLTTHPIPLPPSAVADAHLSSTSQHETEPWMLSRNPYSASLLVDEKFRVLIHPNSASETSVDEQPQAALPNVFAIGDNASIRNKPLPVTAQTAKQEAQWLSARLNNTTETHNDFEGRYFEFRDMGLMTYLGDWKGLLQVPGGSGEKGLGKWAKGLRGRVAWLVWRGAYLGLSFSWRNRVLIPVYWVLNWAFGRDITRF
ncbi:MAG: hypothetical protein Q9190_005107 [Brigantiaea leucoxantha]